MTLKEMSLKKSMFATREINNEMILVPIRNSVSDMNEMFTLNEVASYIWQHIDENITESDLISMVVNEFEVNYNTAQNDVTKFLFRLEKLMI